MPSERHLDSDRIDDLYQYGPDDPMFAPRKRVATISPSDMGKLRAALVGLVALTGIAIHFVALTPYAGAVTQVSFFTMLAALFPCALFPRVAWIGGLVFLVAGFGLVVGVIAYLVHGS